MTSRSALPPRPIFVVGFPRSGTTLLQAMLAAQPGVVSFPETHYFEIAGRLSLLEDTALVSPSVLDELLRLILRASEYSLPESVVSTLQARAAASRLSSRDVFEHLIASCLTGRQATPDEGMRWLEKTPGHAAYMPSILSWYPDAQFICLFRDPRAALSSTRAKLRKRDGTPVSWPRLVRRWRECSQQCDWLTQRHPDRITTVKYESLIDAPAVTLAALSDFLGLPISVSAAMQFRDVSPALVQPREWWKQDVRVNPFANTNDQHRLPLLTTLYVQRALAPEMARHGYAQRLPLLQRAYDACVRTMPQAFVRAWMTP